MEETQLISQAKGIRDDKQYISANDPLKGSHNSWKSVENLFWGHKDTRAMQLEHNLHTITIGDLSLVLITIGNSK